MTENITITTREEFDKYHPRDDNRFVEFKNCVFSFDLIIEHDLIEINCIGCTFENSFVFNSKMHSNCTFKDTIFNGELDISEANLLKKVRFHSCNFNGQTNFQNTKFNDLADFWNSKFINPVIFYKTDFISTTVFAATEFQKNLLFTYTLIKSNLIFRDAVFKSGLDLSLIILSGSINFFNIQLDNYVTVSDNLSEVEFEKNISRGGAISIKNKRETFRIIKHELKKQGNSIDSLAYDALEKASLKEQLVTGFKTSNKKRKNVQDQIILRLSNISNGYGLSWPKAVFFTFAVGLIFFYLSVLATEKYQFSMPKSDNFIDCVSYFFNFMLPTHKISYMDSFVPTWAFYILDFLGRLFVSYGIYQTIIAFRKYNTK